MTEQPTKLDRFAQAMEALTTTAQTQRRAKLLEQRNEEFARAQLDTACYLSQPSHQFLATELAKRWQHIADLEARYYATVLACSGSLKGFWVKFLMPDDKLLHVCEVLWMDVPRLLRFSHLWEALDVTMNRRAAAEFPELVKHRLFKVLGIGLQEGQLVFVYSYWQDEPQQLCLHRLVVREEDLPASAEA